MRSRVLSPSGARSARGTSSATAPATGSATSATNQNTQRQDAHSTKNAPISSPSTAARQCSAFM
jgi:hypothetical protein